MMNNILGALDILLHFYLWVCGQFHIYSNLALLSDVMQNSTWCISLVLAHSQSTKLTTIQCCRCVLLSTCVLLVAWVPYLCCSWWSRLRASHDVLRYPSLDDHRDHETDLIHHGYCITVSKRLLSSIIHTWRFNLKVANTLLVRIDDTPTVFLH